MSSNYITELDDPRAREHSDQVVARYRRLARTNGNVQLPVPSSFFSVVRSLRCAACVVASLPILIRFPSSNVASFHSPEDSIPPIGAICVGIRPWWNSRRSRSFPPGWREFSLLSRACCGEYFDIDFSFAPVAIAPRRCPPPRRARYRPLLLPLRHCCVCRKSAPGECALKCGEEFGLWDDRFLLI